MGLRATVTAETAVVGGRPWATLGSLLLHGAALGLLTWLSLFVPAPPVKEIPLDFVVLAPAPVAPAAPAPPVEEPPPAVEEPVATARPPPPPPPKRREKTVPWKMPAVSGLPEAPPAVAQTGEVPPAIVPLPVEAPPPPPAAVTSDFANLVFDRISRIARRSYPDAARLRHQEGKVVYHLVISPDGGLMDHSIDSSGIDSLDRAAEQAILAAAPFPKPPDLNAATYRMSGAIVYRLEN